MGIKFKAIVKGKVPTAKDFQVAIDTQASATARDALNRFKETTKTWDHKPDFKFRKTSGPPRMRWEVYADDEIYYYVNEGTLRHPIVPRQPGGALAFRSGYAAKSRPGFISSFPGGPSGDMAFAKSVDHPGVEGRHFDVAVAAYMARKYKEDMELALRRTAERFS